MFEEQEEKIGADEWRRIALSVKEDPLEAMVADFLASGGTIEEVPMGKVTSDLSLFNTVDNGHQLTVIRRRYDRIAAADKELVMALEAHLGTCARKELLEMLKVSDYKFQRLLNEYFLNDPRAKQYKRVSK